MMTALRQRMVQFIYDFEARKDSFGNLKVYPLPANDGGGTYEVAGINERYHPNEARELAELIRAGRAKEAEEKAKTYILAYTEVAARWTTSPGVESYLRDCVFNRGPKGAARILQMAVGAPDDGIVGPVTKAAMAKLSPAALLLSLRKAREAYELKIVGRRENLWRGLVNRWDGALRAAQAVEREAFAPAKVPPRDSEKPPGAVKKPGGTLGSLEMLVLLASIISGAVVTWLFGLL